MMQLGKQSRLLLLAIAWVVSLRSIYVSFSSSESSGDLWIGQEPHSISGKRALRISEQKSSVSIPKDHASSVQEAPVQLIEPSLVESEKKKTASKPTIELSSIQQSPAQVVAESPAESQQHKHPSKPTGDISSTQESPQLQLSELSSAESEQKKKTASQTNAVSSIQESPLQTIDQFPADPKQNADASMSTDDISSTQESPVQFYDPISAYYLLTKPSNSTKQRKNQRGQCQWVIGHSSSTSASSSTPEIRFLGGGSFGHAFIVSMDCVVDGNVKPNNMHHTRAAEPVSQTQTIILKLLTSRVDGTGDKAINGKDNRFLGTYKTEERKPQEKNRKLYDRLLPHSTSSKGGKQQEQTSPTKILQHFGIQLGVVDVPPHLLSQAISVANLAKDKSWRYRGITMPDTDTNNMIQGKVFAYMGGDSVHSIVKYLNRDNQLEQEGRQQHVVRDLVFIHQYMFEQGVLNFDFKLWHFLYSPITNRTTIIDLDAHRLLPPLGSKPRTPEENLQEQLQLWNLMKAVANVCDYKEQQRQQKLEGGTVLVNPKKKFASIFDKCGFGNSIKWTDDMLNHTQETYHAFATWSGLSVPSSTRRLSNTPSTQQVSLIQESQVELVQPISKDPPVPTVVVSSIQETPVQFYDPTSAESLPTLTPHSVTSIEQQHRGCRWMIGHKDFASESKKSPGMQFLGAGSYGHAFAVSMNCVVDGSDKPNGRHITTTADPESQTQTVILKLLTEPIEGTDGKSSNGTDNRFLGMYKAEEQHRQERNRRLYDRLFPKADNTQQRLASSTKVLQHFGIQLGVVDVPPHMLRKGIREANRAVKRKWRYRGIQMPDTNKMMIQGKVFAYRGEDSVDSLLTYLSGANQLEQEGRQQHVVRDLIFIYQHMFEKGILNFDMKLSHFLYSPITNITTIIDFDEHALMPPLGANKTRTEAQMLEEKKQQWSLMTVIANVCNYKEQQRLRQQHRQQEHNPKECGPNTMHLCGKQGASNLLTPHKVFASSFDKCGFENSLDWTDEMMDNTRNTYDALATWSGLSVPSSMQQVSSNQESQVQMFNQISKGSSTAAMDVSSIRESPVQLFDPISADSILSFATTAEQQQEHCRWMIGHNDSTTPSNPSSGIRCLGAGANGHAFAISIDCIANGNSKPNEMLNAMGGAPVKRTQTIALKLLSKPVLGTGDKAVQAAHGTDNRFLGTYKTEEEDRQEKNRRLYDWLLPPSNTTLAGDAQQQHAMNKDILQHFGMQLGVVDVPPHLLEDAVRAANKAITKHWRYRGITMRSTDTNNMMIQGKVFAYLGDDSVHSLVKYLNRENQLRQEGRQQHVVRDLIFIYRHLFERGILNCDIKIEHFLYSPITNVTTMIDLDEHRLMAPLESNITRNRVQILQQKKQQWNLMTMIANVCDYKEQQRQQRLNPTVLSPSSMHVCGEHGSHILAKPRQTFESIFDKCGFEKPLNWHRDMMQHTRETYDALATWSGLSDTSNMKQVEFAAS